ncbi:MAG: DUF4271 domain-containing protein [Bacteroidota bacterium]
MKVILSKGIGILLLVLGGVGTAQTQTSNPFELPQRLENAAVILPPTAAESPASVNPNGANPFELAPRLEGAPATAPPPATAGNSNPFELSPVTDVAPPSVEILETAPVDVPQPVTNTVPVGSGILLVFVVAALLLVTIALLFFRELYTKIYRALFNDNLLSQLYREREAGYITGYLLTYLLFFLCGGLFAAIAFNQWGLSPLAYGFGTQVGLYAGGLLGVFLAKHLLLAIIGYIFPLRKEMGRYSFMIMAFSIMLGVVLAVGSVLLAYLPEGWRFPVLYGTGGFVIISYVWRSIRGLFQANPLFFKHPFHFLSYICAIEIGPVIILFKTIGII